MTPSRPWTASFWRNLAFQDDCILLFHGYMTLRVLLAPDGADARTARPLSCGLLAITMLTVIVVRGEVLPAGLLRAVWYRVGMVAPLVLNYFVLRYSLPAMGVPLRDRQLLHIDQWLLGQTPAQSWAHLCTPSVVEWFSFFYYSYFTLLVLHVLGSLFLDRGRRMHELLVGAMLVTAGGHVLYTLVPGVGPHGAMSFARPLQGGRFYHLMLATVAQAGAMLDIFPSLHTGHPCLFLLHSFRHRAHAPYRYSLVPMAFFCGNIMIATLLLRWHYAIDVMAGVLLAFCAQRVAILSATREVPRDGPPVWDALA